MAYYIHGSGHNVPAPNTMDAEACGVRFPLPAALAPKSSHIPASLAGLSQKLATEPAAVGEATFSLPRAYAIKAEDEIPVAIEPPRPDAVRSLGDLRHYLAMASLRQRGVADLPAQAGITTGNALLAERTQQMHEAVQELVDSGDLKNYKLSQQVGGFDRRHFYIDLDPALRRKLRWTSID